MDAALLPFLREVRPGTWNRLLDAVGSKDAQRIASLGGRQEAMIALRVENGLSLKRIGEIFDLTRERIRQLTPPGIWKDKEPKGLFSQEEFGRVLGRAIYDKGAWTGRDGTSLSVSWLAKGLGVDISEIYSIGITKGLYKFDLMLQYGYELASKEEQIEWMNQKYYREGMPYSAIAAHLSKRFVYISTMNVYRRMNALGFRGRLVGRMSDAEYMADADAW